MANLQRVLQRYLTAILPPGTETRLDGNSILLTHGCEVEVRIEPERLWVQSTRIHWDGHTPVPQVDRELSLRLDKTAAGRTEAAALAIVSVVQAVFGPRLSSYTQCEDCGDWYPPERMTDAWCHGCASGNHGVVY